MCFQGDPAKTPEALAAANSHLGRSLPKPAASNTAQALNLTVAGPDGPMSLDLPDIHDPASVSLQVTRFCEYFTAMLAYMVGPEAGTNMELGLYRHGLVTIEACYVDMMVKVEKRTGVDYGLLSQTVSNDKPAASNTTKALSLAIPGMDGDPVNLDIPDIYDPASVSIHITRFCKPFTPSDACFGEMLKMVEERTGEDYGLLPESCRHNKPGALSTP